MRAVDVVSTVAHSCLPVYLRCFDKMDDKLAWAGITTPLRLSHFLAQGLHETGGGTIMWENMSYSASRLVEVFGPGRSSAAVGSAEAARLAHNPQAIAERVYGLGNPHMAHMLGNTQHGDGYAFRGTSFMQTTGREAFHKYGVLMGVPIDQDSSLLADDKYAILPAIYEWQTPGKGLNALADQNDIHRITRIINGGYNGLASREDWFSKIWRVVNQGNSIIPWTVSAPAANIKYLQGNLNDLGYTPQLAVDGLRGPATKAAVEWFQNIQGLKVDGIAGPLTLGKIAQLLATHNNSNEVLPAAA